MERREAIRLVMEALDYIQRNNRVWTSNPGPSSILESAPNGTFLVHKDFGERAAEAMIVLQMDIAPLPTPTHITTKVGGFWSDDFIAIKFSDGSIYDKFNNWRDK